MASFGDYNRVNTNVTAMDAQLSLNKINRDLERVGYDYLLDSRSITQKTMQLVLQ